MEASTRVFTHFHYIFHLKLMHFHMSRQTLPKSMFRQIFCCRRRLWFVFYQWLVGYIVVIKYVTLYHNYGRPMQNNKVELEYLQTQPVRHLQYICFWIEEFTQDSTTQQELWTEIPRADIWTSQWPNVWLNITPKLCAQIFPSHMMLLLKWIQFGSVSVPIWTCKTTTYQILSIHPLLLGLIVSCLFE